MNPVRMIREGGPSKLEPRTRIEMSYKTQNARQSLLFGGSAPWNELLAAAEEQAAPTRPEADMFDLVREVGLKAGHIALDIGSYGGRHAIPLAAKFGCHSIALDLVWGGLSGAPTSILEAGVDGRVYLLQADAHEVPLQNECIDLIWSYDMVGCVEPVRFFTECERILTPEGAVVLHMVHFTDLMEPKERARLAAALALTDGWDQTRAERAIEEAGLSVVKKQAVGASWVEASLLDGSSSLADDLLTVIRLRRGAETLISQFSQPWFETILNSYHWATLTALGKLEVTLYLLRKQRGSARRDTWRRSSG